MTQYRFLISQLSDNKNMAGQGGIVEAGSGQDAVNQIVDAAFAHNEIITPDDVVALEENHFDVIFFEHANYYGWNNARIS